MQTFMSVVRKVWLATTMFVVASIAAWWARLDWVSAQDHILPTLVVTPLGWWLLFARARRPGLRRGMIVGGIVGLVSQLLPHITLLWNIAWSPLGDVGQQVTSAATLGVYVLVGYYALTIGAIVGMLVALCQKWTDRRRPVPITPPKANAATEAQAHRKAG